MDREDARLRSAGIAPVQPLKDEPHGQRLAIYSDTNGILIDATAPIPPSAEFLAAYANEAVPA